MRPRANNPTRLSPGLSARRAAERCGPFSSPPTSDEVERRHPSLTRTTSRIQRISTRNRRETGTLTSWEAPTHENDFGQQIEELFRERTFGHRRFGRALLPSPSRELGHFTFSRGQVRGRGRLESREGFSRSGDAVGSLFFELDCGRRTDLNYMTVWPTNFLRSSTCPKYS